MDVKISAKENEKGSKSKENEAKKQAKQLDDEYKKELNDLHEQLTENLSNILLGEKIPLDVTNAETDEVIIPANRKITKTLLRKLSLVYNMIAIDPSPIKNKILEIIGGFTKRFDDLKSKHKEQASRVAAGDEIDSGVIKSVRVFIASKRKLSVGVDGWTPRQQGCCGCGHPEHAF